jgi:ribA/ribD-fused uncharacterized protein
MKETANYVFFFGGMYSQWAGIPFQEGDVKFNCTEQYMMYWKALAFGDLKSAERIMETYNPAEQKAIGRKVKGFNDERWDLIKYQVVYQGNYLKFSQNPDLLDTFLIKHKDKMFVEASPTDTIWGIGRDLSFPYLEDQSKWNGQNLLGCAIKEVQQKLIEDEVPIYSIS